MNSCYLSTIKLRAEIERKIMQSLLFKNCKSRISCFLIELALTQKYLEGNDNSIIELDISMQEFSSFIGAKRQTVSTVFNELIIDKIIERVGKHKYKILDWSKLRSI